MVLQLEEVQSVSEASMASPVFDTVFSHESISPRLVKSTALEELLNLAAKDCKFDDFMRDLLGLFIRAVRSEAGSVLEVNQADQSIFFRAVMGQSSDRVVDFIIPGGRGVAGHAVDSRTPVVVNNVPENREHLKAIEAAVGFVTRNLVAIPILIRGKAYGVIELLNRIDAQDFTPADIEFLSYLAKMAAKCIEIRLMISWAKKQRENG